MKFLKIFVLCAIAVATCSVSADIPQAYSCHCQYWVDGNYNGDYFEDILGTSPKDAEKNSCAGDNYDHPDVQLGCEVRPAQQPSATESNPAADDDGQSVR